LFTLIALLLLPCCGGGDSGTHKDIGPVDVKATFRDFAKPPLELDAWEGKVVEVSGPLYHDPSYSYETKIADIVIGDDEGRVLAKLPGGPIDGKKGQFVTVKGIYTFGAVRTLINGVLLEGPK
jgi:hypothetical protein